MAATDGVQHLDSNENPDTALHKIRTAGSISISPELFEKLYLSPQIAVKGQLRSTFGNPTPLGLAGFLLSLTPLTCDLLGWRQASLTASVDGSADIGVYFFFGGILMLVASVMEWILGNTYIFVVFGTFGSFWLTFAATLQPYFFAYGNYSPNPAKEALGLTTAGFNDTFGYFLLFMGLLCTIYLICSLRTNMVLVGILVPLPFAFGFLTAAFWYNAKGDTAYAGTMQLAGASFIFVTDVLGWYLFFALMLAAIDAPFNLPVGDLSHRIKGASERAKAKEANNGEA